MNLPDYKQILKKALDLTLKHKALWFLGLLFTGFGNLNVSNYTWRFPAENSNLLTERYGHYLSQVPDNPWLLAALGTLALIVFVLIIYIAATAKAAIIKAAPNLDKAVDLKVVPALKGGQSFAAPLIITHIAGSLGLLLVVSILLLPILYFLQKAFLGASLTLGIIAAVIFIFSAFLISVSVIFASNFVVLGNLSPWQGLLAGIELVRVSLRQTLIFAAVLLLANLTAILVFLAAAGLIFAPILILYTLFQNYISAVLLTVILAVLVFVFIISFLLLSGLLSSWQTLSWVYFWQTLVAPEKAEPEPVEEAEPAAEPTLG